MAAEEVEIECGDISASQEDLIAHSSFLGGDCLSDRELGLEGEGGHVSSTPAPDDEPINMCSLPFTPPRSARHAAAASPLPIPSTLPHTAGGRTFPRIISPSTPYAAASTPPPPAAASTLTNIVSTSTPRATVPPAGGDEWPEEDGEEEVVAVKQRRRPRVCARKVRGAKIRTPSPSPEPNDRAGKEQPVGGSVANPGQGRGRGRGATGVDPLYNVVTMLSGELDPDLLKMDILELARQRGLF